MKLLANSAVEKQRLMEASARHKKEITEEVKTLTQTTERIALNTLFIGGAIVLTYFAVSQLSKSKKKKAKRIHDHKQGDSEVLNENEQSSSSSLVSHIGDIVITQATMLLLEFAKEKLSDYLQSKKSPDEDS